MISGYLSKRILHRCTFTAGCAKLAKANGANSKTKSLIRIAHIVDRYVHNRQPLGLVRFVFDDRFVPDVSSRLKKLARRVAERSKLTNEVYLASVQRDLVGELRRAARY